jgi:hypothetical protein
MRREQSGEMLEGPTAMGEDNSYMWDLVARVRAVERAHKVSEAIAV